MVTIRIGYYGANQKTACSAQSGASGVIVVARTYGNYDFDQSREKLPVLCMSHTI
jgi:hypothetical protein